MPILRVERYTHTLKGEPTVAVAAQLMNSLPNGWTLKDFHYQRPEWVAVVEGPVTEVR